MSSVLLTDFLPILEDIQPPLLLGFSGFRRLVILESNTIDVVRRGS
jgi:hypothetical protein